MEKRPTTDTQKIRQLERQLADCDNVSNADIQKKIDLLNDLAWALSDTDMQRAQSLSQTAHTLATSTGNGSASYPLGVAYSLRTQGYLNLRLGNYPLGLSQLLKAQEIFESLNHSQGLPDVFDHIAGIYFQIGDFPEALSYMYKQLEAAQRLGDKRLIANAYNNLANIYLETGDYHRASETLRQNLQLANEISFARIECLSYLNLAETYLAMGDNTLALEHCLRGLKVSQAVGFELFEVYAFDFIGKAHLKLGNTRQALSNFEEALALSRKIESKVTESLILLNLGQAYREMRQFDLALNYLQQGVTIAQAINANSELLKGHLLLSEIFEQQGDFAQALHHFKQQHAFKELVLGEKADQRLKVLQITHDTATAKNEAEILRLRTVELQREVADRTQAELQVQRQLEYVRALSACSQTLLVASDSEADNRRLLGEALQHLVKPARASKVFLYENFDDPQLGFCSRFIVHVCAPGIPAALDDPTSAVIPWAIAPEENRRRLAAGEPVGGPTKTLFAATPSFRDYLLNKVHALSVLFVPIHFGEQWWGYVGFDDRINEREWQEEEILLLGAAAEMLSGALQRWQTEARERRQRQIAESLQQVALVLNSTLDQKQIVTAILGQLQAIMPYDGAAIWLIEGEELKIVEAAGLSLDRVGWSLPLDSDTPQTLVIHNRQPQIVADVTAEPRWPQWDVTEIIRSWMGTPLLAAQEAIGLLTLVRSDPGAFDLDDLQVLQSFANQAVTAISNARLYQQISTARERLSILYQASQVISAASLVPQQIYAGIHGAVARLMPADVFVVTLVNEAEQEAEDVYLVDQGQVWPSQRYPLPGTFAHYLLRRGESLRADDYSALLQEEFSFELFGSMEDTRSGLAVLLRGRERVLGLLSVQSYELATYTDDDLELLELLAAHAAIALENTRLYKQAQTAATLEERNRLARDLHDSVTQSLYSLTLLAEGWRRLAQRGRLADLDGALTELGEIAQQSLKEMRLLIYELRPPALEQAGLLGALHQRLGAVERRAGIDARLIAAELIELPPQVEQGLYRITQEALNNALKHAKATAVTVFVRASGEWIEVEVTDNGCGFEPDRLNGQPGLGLISMRERAEQLGGELVVESQPGVGTTVQLKVSINS